MYPPLEVGLGQNVLSYWLLKPDCDHNICITSTPEVLYVPHPTQKYLSHTMQCFAGYYHIKYGHLLD